MATHFDNNPKFQSLSPEAKEIVMRKFQGLSPEAQQIVTKKLSGHIPIPEDVINEPGVEPASVLSDVQKASAQGLGAVGALALRPTKAGLEESSQIAQGQPAESIPGKIGKFVGESVSPAGLAAGAAIGKTVKAAGSAIKTLLPGTQKAVGAGIGAAEEAVGVTKKLPTVANLAKRFDLPTRERSFNDIVNHVSERLAKNEKVPVQDLKDFLRLTNDRFATGHMNPESEMGAITSEVANKATAALNKSAPGRAALAAEYARIKRLKTLMKTIAVNPVTKKIGSGLAAGLGLGAGWKVTH